MMIHDGATPYITKSNAAALSATPICANLYATPRINKRNADENLQSTTKKLVIILYLTFLGFYKEAECIKYLFWPQFFP